MNLPVERRENNQLADGSLYILRCGKRGRENDYHTPQLSANHAILAMCYCFSLD